jgi:hypothetical protein
MLKLKRKTGFESNFKGRTDKCDEKLALSEREEKRRKGLHIWRAMYPVP